MVPVTNALASYDWWFQGLEDTVKVTDPLTELSLWGHKARIHFHAAEPLENLWQVLTDNFALETKLYT